jgi:hypothetical protein
VRCLRCSDLAGYSSISRCRGVVLCLSPQRVVGCVGEKVEGVVGFRFGGGRQWWLWWWCSVWIANAECGARIGMDTVGFEGFEEFRGIQENSVELQEFSRITKNSLNSETVLSILFCCCFCRLFFAASESGSEADSLSSLQLFNLSNIFSR